MHFYDYSEKAFVLRVNKNKDCNITVVKKTKHSRLKFCFYSINGYISNSSLH